MTLRLLAIRGGLPRSTCSRTRSTCPRRDRGCGTCRPSPPPGTSRRWCRRRRAAAAIASPARRVPSSARAPPRVAHELRRRSRAVAEAACLPAPAMVLGSAHISASAPAGTTSPQRRRNRGSIAKLGDRMHAAAGEHGNTGMRLSWPAVAGGCLRRRSIAAAGLPRVAARRLAAIPPTPSGPLDLHEGRVDQVRRSIRAQGADPGRFSTSSALDRRPDTTEPAERFICLQIHRAGHTFMRQLCFGGPEGQRTTPSGYALLRPRVGAIVGGGSRRGSKRPSGAPWRRASSPAAPTLLRGTTAGASSASRTGAEVPGPAEARGAPRRLRCFDRSERPRRQVPAAPVQPVGCTDGGPAPLRRPPAATSGSRSPSTTARAPTRRRSSRS